MPKRFKSTVFIVKIMNVLVIVINYSTVKWIYKAIILVWFWLAKSTKNVCKSGKREKNLSISFIINLVFSNEFLKISLTCVNLAEKFVSCDHETSFQQYLFNTVRGLAIRFSIIYLGLIKPCSG